MSKVFLPRYVYFCFTDAGAVFLDLKKDLYAGLDPVDSDTLRLLADQEQPATERTARLVTELIERGFLTHEAARGKPLSPTSFPVARTTLCGAWPHTLPAISSGHIRRLIAAYALVRVRLSIGIWRAAQYRGAQQAELAAHHFDPETTRDLVRTFLNLRPLIFGARDRCLLSSLVLSEFLSMHGIQSTLVIGVKTSPFTAHCWLQRDGVILNGRAERVSEFTPIMAI